MHCKIKVKMDYENYIKLVRWHMLDNTKLLACLTPFCITNTILGYFLLIKLMVNN